MQLQLQTLPQVRPVDRITRPRLEGRLAGPVAAPIAVLVGPPGAGKSELLRPFRTDEKTIFFRAGNERATFGRFVYGLARAAAALAPGAAASFPRAWERALQSPQPAIVLAHWLCEHLQGVAKRIVIDDLHAASDLSIGAFIGKLAELRPDASLTIAARSVGALPVALWMATRRMDRPIDEAELRFDREEIAALALAFGLKLDAQEIDALQVATDASAITFALARLRCDPLVFSRDGMPTTFEAVADGIFARRSDRERAFLFSAVLYPTIEDRLLELSGWTDAAAIRDAMRDDAPFMWEENVAGSIAFHDRFRTYLDRQFETCADDFRSEVAHSAVHSLAAAARYAEALDVASKRGLRHAVGGLLDKHGFEILESGEIDVIGDALRACDGPQETMGATASALHGYLEARRGHLDTAEAWFRLGLAKAEDESARLRIAMYYARELAVRRREDACDVMAPFADSTTLARAALVDVQSSFAQALTAADRHAEACARTAEALALLEPDCAPALRARVLARAAYVALESGDMPLARERAQIAAPLAVAQSLYDVAASTYSVLYQIAYDVDDDAQAAREYLQRMRDLGIKSGTLRLESYVLFGLYELEVEAGNEAALNEIDRQLAVIDKHDSAWSIMEGLVPSKALQAGWSGDFRTAQQVLRPIAEHQATSARKALCWGQIGLYCAAAGDAREAAEAVDKAEAELSACDSTGTVQFGRALLTLALAAWVSGDVARARYWTNRVGDATIGRAPRLRALRDVIETMTAASGDAKYFTLHLPGALSRLRGAAFGGLAKLIEALPYQCGAAGPLEAIGSVLAQHELSEQFAAAVAEGNGRVLHTWLDAAPASIFNGAPLTERFNRWVEANQELVRPAPPNIRNLRTLLATYRRSVPAFVRLVDDIDAALEALLESLDVAAPLMAEHSRAVSAWCERIARTLGLSNDSVTLAARAGLIHDIGKLRTPPGILNSAHSLSPQEWTIMKDHALQGARIVAGFSLLEPLVPAVRGHHERLDGGGYPDGLGFRAIALTTRIVTVADCFNAMIGRRAYRLPLSPADALDELQRHRGTQFDPEVVDAMIRVVQGRFDETADG